MKITRIMLRSWNACYSDEEISTLVPESGLTPLEVAELNILVVDRLWVLLRKEIISTMELRLLACDWAEEACRMSGWSDERSLAAIAVARRFAVGEATEDELSAAAREARAASWAAVGASEFAATAAVDAAALVAEEAAWKAAWSAAWSAARSAWEAADARASKLASRAGLRVARSAQLAATVKVLKG